MAEQLTFHFPVDLRFEDVFLNEELDSEAKEFILRAWTFWPSLANTLIECGEAYSQQEAMLVVQDVNNALKGQVCVCLEDIEAIKPRKRDSLPAAFKRLQETVKRTEVNENVLKLDTTQLQFGAKSHKAFQFLILRRPYISEQARSDIRELGEWLGDICLTPSKWMRNYNRADLVFSLLVKEMEKALGQELPFLSIKGDPWRKYLKLLAYASWAMFLIHFDDGDGKADRRHFFEVSVSPTRETGRRHVDCVLALRLDKYYLPTKFHIGHILWGSERAIMTDWKVMFCRWNGQELILPIKRPLASDRRQMEDYICRSIRSYGWVKNKGKFKGFIDDLPAIEAQLQYIHPFGDPITHKITIRTEVLDRLLLEMGLNYNRAKRRAQLRQLANALNALIKGKYKTQLSFDLSSPIQGTLESYGWKGEQK